MFEHMVRTRDTLKNPTLLFQAAFDVATIREHVIPPRALKPGLEGISLVTLRQP